MKIAYVSAKCFSDVDLSYLSEAQKIMNITYFVPVFGNRLKGAAFDLQIIYPKYGVFKAIDAYPELRKFSRLIDSSRFYVINSKASHMWNPLNLWLYIKFIWKLRDFDVIHITDFPYYYEWFYYLLRKKIVLTVHDPIPHSAAVSNRFIVRLNRYIGFRLIDNFILLNKAQKDECIKLYNLYDKKIYESRLGRYDYLKIYKCDTLNTNEYILFFGQITSHKGLDYLLPAMVNLHNMFPKTKLILAGKGEYDFDIMPYKKLEYIEFRNRFIPDEELAYLIQNSLFVVCPYKDATQSGVVMSAYAFNKPVVATAVGGLPEMVIDGKLGTIVVPCDVEALSEAICDLLANPQKIEKYARNIDTEYNSGEKSWIYIASEMKSIYEQICKK